MLVTLRRIFKFAFQDFFRNFVVSLAVIVTIFLMLLAVNLVLGLNHISYQAAQILEEQIDVSVYLKSGVSEEMVKGFRSFLMGFEEIKDVEIISPEMALQKFKERHKNDPKILDALAEIEKNPLGATLVVKLRDISKYQDVLNALDHPSYKDIVEDKDYTDYSLLISRVNEVSQKIKVISLLLIIFFGLIASLVVFNSVRMAIYNHKEEIGIMKLVGASDAFIWSPFLFEGIFSGFVAAVLVVLCVVPAVILIDPYLVSFFGSGAVVLREYFFGNVFKIFGLEFLFSIALYSLSGILAIRRYLHT